VSETQIDPLTKTGGCPPGEYCIVELFGHTTLVGRYAEVDRFGTKMLALEPLFQGMLLPPVFHGGAAIYRLTPCTAEVAWKRQPMQGYQIPAAILATVPAALLPAPLADVLDATDLSFSGGDDE